MKNNSRGAVFKVCKYVGQKQQVFLHHGKGLGLLGMCVLFVCVCVCVCVCVVTEDSIVFIWMR